MKYFIPIFFLNFLSLFLFAEEDPYEEFKVKRKEVFEFTQKPKITEKKDIISIEFEVKDFCDVTIAIENKQGKIVRHLASGVLGKNAPEPLLKNSLKQKIIWDGKNDQGRYLDNRDDINIRVSLGLKASYDKSLFYSPHKRISGIPLLQMTPEGLYVFEAMGRDHLRLFNRDGEYVKTIYPFPANQINNVKGMKWDQIPGREKVPHKESKYHQTILSSGDNAHGNGMKGNGAVGMAVHGKRIALAFVKLNRLSTDGSTDGLPLKGPVTGMKIKKGGYGGFGKGKQDIGPSSMAFSPDGETLYMTGYSYKQRHGGRPGSLQGVMKLNYKTNEPMTVFAGNNKVLGFGTDDKHFTVPTSVETDAKGNVYVSDFFNNRVQIFDASGKLIKTIKTKYPAKVLVHKKTQEIYIFSWAVIGLDYNLQKKLKYNPRKFKQTLTHVSAYPECKLKSTEPINLGPGSLGSIFAMGQIYNVVLDSWSKDLAFWIVGRKHIVSLADIAANAWAANKLQNPDLWKSGIRKIQKLKGKWTPTVEFSSMIPKDTVPRIKPPKWNIQELYVNPQNEKLYVAEADSGPTGKAFKELIEIDPKTGKAKVIQLPLNPMDIAFDLSGLIYMRTTNVLCRFDLKTMKEIPFDYGADRKSVGKDGGIGGRSTPVISAIMLPASNVVCYHQSGISVNVKGEIAVACGNRTGNFGISGVLRMKKIDSAATYKQFSYPGRLLGSTSVCIHIWDKNGKMLVKDAVPGAPQADGVFIDKNNNVYMMATPPRTIKGKHIGDGMSSTLIKFKPKNGRFISSGKSNPIPLSKNNYPTKKQDLRGLWTEKPEWIYGGVGFGGFNGAGCACWFSRFKLDYFARTFAPEPLQFSVGVLDSNGNLILRVGKYGNEDSRGAKSLVPLGGDEVGLFHPCFVGVHTDRRLYIADIGNARIVNVKLDYHKNVVLSLR
ncbi:MAG: hypothetical protein COA79_14965 [Planctomycetota bacterium]|nr:MAG: hypothetical protein COA79_14965 [Planctomycetota bacterium]